MKEILFKNLFIYLFIYIAPIVVYIILSNINNQHKFTTIIISFSYIVLNLCTIKYSLNILPFFIVILCIKQIKDITLNSSIFNTKYKDYYRYFNIKNFKLWEGIKFFIITYAITLVISNISLFIFNTLNINAQQQEVVKMMQNVPFKVFLLYIPCTILFAPILEEFIFRWLLFEKIFNKMFSVRISAIITSAIFGIIHFNIMAFPAIMTMGLINCYLIHKKGYWYSVFNHILFNSITTICIFINRISNLWY